jgi:hypothetical protein
MARNLQMLHRRDAINDDMKRINCEYESQIWSLEEVSDARSKYLLSLTQKFDGNKWSWLITYTDNYPNEPPIIVRNGVIWGDLDGDQVEVQHKTPNCRLGQYIIQIWATVPVPMLQTSTKEFYDQILEAQVQLMKILDEQNQLQLKRMEEELHKKNEEVQKMKEEIKQSTELNQKYEEEVQKMKEEIKQSAEVTRQMAEQNLLQYKQRDKQTLLTTTVALIPTVATAYHAYESPTLVNIFVMATTLALTARTAWNCYYLFLKKWHQEQGKN